MKIKQFYFCPKCHNKVIPPAFLIGDGVNIAGTINIKCGSCKKGKVVIKPEFDARQPLGFAYG